jgi:DNA replication and repair protein RecF
MRLREIRLERFRNHAMTVIECAERQNVFLGNNGEGKTNILEAISFLCLTKSFYAASDATVVQLGKTGFTVTGDALSDIDVGYRIGVSYDVGSREKNIVINQSPVDSRSSVIGMFPVVVLSPENGTVTTGTPSDRRRFIDIVISQSSREYLEELIEYRRILRQRNRILFDAKMSQREALDVLEPWNESLVQCGAHIFQRRARFIGEFKPFLVDAFNKIVGGSEVPSISYEASLHADVNASVDSIREAFGATLKEQYAAERKLGTTIIGPHKDELGFEINNLGLRSFASQGQHKTFVVALKIAEFFYLRERCKETPLLLLDDVFSELDGQRSERLLKLTSNLGQSFITATDESKFSAVLGRERQDSRFYVSRGSVTIAKPTVFTN